MLGNGSDDFTPEQLYVVSNATDRSPCSTVVLRNSGGSMCLCLLEIDNHRREPGVLRRESASAHISSLTD
jgi:hypothetical protein